MILFLVTFHLFVAGHSFIDNAISLYQSPCPNRCSANGKCTLPYGICQCFLGFTGADCSLRTCPQGVAWTDDLHQTTLTGNDDGHRLATCSNRGLCDQVLGECYCERDHFEGAACERKICPKSCSNNGQCISASMLAQEQDPGIIHQNTGCTSSEICLNGNCTFRDYSNCRSIHVYETPWDASSMFGCLCDSGFQGHDCSQRACPTGDDPMTTSQANEVQLLECTATSGTFTLSFLGFSTVPISANATISELSEAITILPSITKTRNKESIQVQYSSLLNQACNETGNSIFISFLQNFGDLPLLIPDGTQLAHSQSGMISLITSQKYIPGSKENVPCSNHGLCDYDTGTCSCFDSWASSDGYGSSGTRGDCGYWNNPNTTTSCPGVPTCHNHGICSGSPEFQCQCEDGRFGADCSLFSCPKGRSWFSSPVMDNTAHSLSECSDMGTCDRETGVCDCADGFTGSACEYSSCPGDFGTTCNNHGLCLPMSSLAAYNKNNGDPMPFQYGTDLNNPLTWDHDQMKGCLCSQGWEGFDCSLRSCPKGDDPQTSHQFNEIQVLTCVDSDLNGSFTLTFRGEQTVPLTVNDTLLTLQAALNDLSTIHSVSVTLFNSSSMPSTVCSTTNQTVAIEFLSPTGDLPLLKLTSTQIDDVSVSELIQGTKEYVECSNRGICDYSRGLCFCFIGFGSSDGQGNAGILGDCGYRIPHPLG
jgi:hypothetical protein